MLETRYHWLPVFIVIYLPISFIITYSIAVSNDHVEAGFPYISDTGTKSPESCVFGQLLNIGAVISGIIVYIRYRHIHEHVKDIERREKQLTAKEDIERGEKQLTAEEDIDRGEKQLTAKEDIKRREKILCLNKATFIIGILTNFGVSVVGNFQETNINIVHLIGAFLAFGVGFVYMILQTITSYKTVGKEALPGSTSTVRIFRVSLCVADGILLIIFGVSTRIALSKGPGPGKSTQKWSADEPGHTEHVIAAVSEWMVAFVTVAYFATFYSEFKQFQKKPDCQRQATSIATTSCTKTPSNEGYNKSQAFSNKVTPSDALCKSQQL